MKNSCFIKKNYLPESVFFQFEISVSAFIGVILFKSHERISSRIISSSLKSPGAAKVLESIPDFFKLSVEQT